MGISERGKEIKRRRHRRRKLEKLRKQFDQAKPSHKQHIVEKIRRLTPGAEKVFSNWGVDEE